MKMEPQSVIVYRSQGERLADEFWYSEGLVAPTKAGDAILACFIGALIILVFHFFSKLRKRARRRW